MRLGVISDTHGLLRPRALEILHACDVLLHAGDIGSPDILVSLAALAPVTAVRGNNDTGDWARALPESITLEVEGLRLHLVHDVKQLAVDPAIEHLAVIVSGHSHRPGIDTRAGVLYFNPGSAGPRRFKLPISVGILELANGLASGHIVELT
jgi:uncharacterized protein